jgi:hypothetical protein
MRYAFVNGYYIRIQQVEVRLCKRCDQVIIIDVTFSALGSIAFVKYSGENVGYREAKVYMPRKVKLIQ